ncbi:hypothetical protein BOX15_Mlig027002g1, partial [Macrostomum lignano]
DLLVGKAAELPPSPHPPPQPSARVYSVRPYSAADRSSVYAICALTAPMRIAGASTSAAAGSNGVVVDDAAAAASVAVSIAGPGPGVGIMSAADAELYGDRYAGLLLELSCDYCFVLESDTGVCGFVCAALDVAKLRDQAGEFFGLMRRRHPMLRRRGAGGAVSSAGTGAGGGHEAAVHPAAHEAIEYFHSQQPEPGSNLPNQVLSRFPSVVHLDALPGVFSTEQDLLALRRLLACCFAALKTNGSPGVHCRLAAGDATAEVYKRLGFLELSYTTDSRLPSSVTLLGRPI